MISEAKLMDRMEWAQSFPDKFFDVWLDDPEWGIGAGTMAFTRENNLSVVQKNGSRKKIRKNLHEQKKWDTGTPNQEYWDLARQKSKNQIVFGTDYFDWTEKPIGRLEWDKLRPDGLSFKNTEMAFQSFDDHLHSIQCLWSGMMQAKSEHHPTIQQGNKRLNEKRIHVCQKPVILWKLIFKEFNIPAGSNIGCPNFGSGTNRRAAYDYGMNWFGCEKDPDFFDMAGKEFDKYKKISDLHNKQLCIWGPL